MKHPYEDDPLWGAASRLIGELAPLTRRDDWWTTEGPQEIIYRALKEAHNEDVGEGKGY